MAQNSAFLDLGEKRKEKLGELLPQLVVGLFFFCFFFPELFYLNKKKNPTNLLRKKNCFAKRISSHI